MAVYIGTGDTEPSGDFLLCQFLLSPQTITKNDNNLLSFTETFLYCVQHFFRFDGKMQLFRKIMRGVTYKPIGASALLRRNLFIYGLGGLIAPFIGIKLIDMLISVLF